MKFTVTFLKIKFFETKFMRRGQFRAHNTQPDWKESILSKKRCQNMLVSLSLVAFVGIMTKFWSYLMSQASS